MARNGQWHEAGSSLPAAGSLAAARADARPLPAQPCAGRHGRGCTSSDFVDGHCCWYDSAGNRLHGWLPGPARRASPCRWRLATAAGRVLRYRRMRLSDSTCDHASRLQNGGLYELPQGSADAIASGNEASARPDPGKPRGAPLPAACRPDRLAHQADLQRPGSLLVRPHRPRQPRLPDAKVPQHAAWNARSGNPPPGGSAGVPDANRIVSAPIESGRVAAAVERPGRRHEPRRAAPGAVQPARSHRVANAARGPQPAPRADGLGAGEWP